MTFRQLSLFVALVQLTGSNAVKTWDAPSSPAFSDDATSSELLVEDDPDVEEDVSIFMQQTTFVDRHPFTRWAAWIGSPLFRALLAALLLIPAFITYAGNNPFQGLRGFPMPPFGANSVAEGGASSRRLAATASPIDDKVLDALLRDQPCCDGPLGPQTGVRLIRGSPSMVPRQSEHASSSTDATTHISDHALDALLEGANKEAAMVASFRMQKGVDVNAGTASVPTAASSTTPPISDDILDALLVGADEEAAMVASFRLQKGADMNTGTASVPPSASRTTSPIRDDVLEALLVGADEEATKVASFRLQQGADVVSTPSTPITLSGKALDDLVADANEEAAMVATFRVQKEADVVIGKQPLSALPSAAPASTMHVAASSAASPTTLISSKALDSLVAGADEEAAIATSFGVQTDVMGATYL